MREFEKAFENPGFFFLTLCGTVITKSFEVSLVYFTYKYFSIEIALISYVIIIGLFKGLNNYIIEENHYKYIKFVDRTLEQFEELNDLNKLNKNEISKLEDRVDSLEYRY